MKLWIVEVFNFKLSDGRDEQTIARQKIDKIF